MEAAKAKNMQNIRQDQVGKMHAETKDGSTVSE